MSLQEGCVFTYTEPPRTPLARTKHCFWEKAHEDQIRTARKDSFETYPSSSEDKC